MQYDDIIQAALSYADREDEDVVKQMDVFLRVVESRINKNLTLREQYLRAAILISEETEYYGLPKGFSRLRDIEIKTHVSSGERFTPRYLNPEQMNAHITSGSSVPSYTIIANQIQLFPTHDQWVCEIVYAAKVEPLTNVDPENWLTLMSPSTYIFGLLVEINAFVRDQAAAEVWDSRFTTDMDQLIMQDDSSKWSGSSLQIRVG